MAAPYAGSHTPTSRGSLGSRREARGSVARLEGPSAPRGFRRGGKTGPGSSHERQAPLPEILLEDRHAVLQVLGSHLLPRVEHVSHEVERFPEREALTGHL